MNKLHLNLKQAGTRAFCFLVPFIVFLIVSIFLSYRIILLPSLVIGDNFHWTKLTTLDVLGPKILRESFLGDIAILSTFKNGILFPIIYSFVILELPTSILYPFLFYFLCMLSFYSLSREFLRSRILCVTISLMYVINPITPYYYASVLSAYALVFLPLTLKFFAKTLRDIVQHDNKTPLLKNYVLTGLFLSLTVSAHEQFFLSCALLGVYITIAFVVTCLKKFGVNRQFVTFSLINISVFSIVFLLVNAPLILSVSKVSMAPFATYFTGRFRDFLANVQYTYAKANIDTLLRFGGDSGVGLGSSSWYDSDVFTNIFGYSTLILFLVSVVFLVRNRKILSDKPFFSMNIILFVNGILFIVLIKYLPSNLNMAQNLFSFLLQTWQSPIKLRILILLSGLTTTFVALRKLEMFGDTNKRKILRNFAILLLIGSMVAYNNPWLITYIGQSPLQQIAENQNWGNLFDHEYSNLVKSLEENFSDERGIVIPYTHKAELYLPPNFRLLQLTSATNEQVNALSQTENFPWSKFLGLLSVKYVIARNQFDEEEVLFPKLPAKDAALVMQNMKEDVGLKLEGTLGNYTIFENQNTLPTIYATRFFIFYDDLSTLKYACERLDFKNLPVFLNAEAQTNQLSIPRYIHDDTYEVTAISLDGDIEEVNIPITITNGYGERVVNLFRVNETNGANFFSNSAPLHPGDILELRQTPRWTEALNISELIIDSDSFPVGQYGSFMLNFTVNIIRKGQFSFLGPRVVFDSDSSKRYFLIFHDNGFLELAVQQDESFASRHRVAYAGYDLENENDLIKVAVIRRFDEVEVYIDDSLIMSFPIESNISNVHLTSEQSMSKFTGISIGTRKIIKLYAARKTLEPLIFSVNQTDYDNSVLVVQNGYSEYAVVSQYLYTSIRKLDILNEPKGQMPPYEVGANAFFQGWIFHGANYASKERDMEIRIEGSEIALGLVAISTSCTILLLIISISHVCPLSNWFRELVHLSKLRRKKVSVNRT